MDKSYGWIGGIEHLAQSIGAVLEERLPWQRKTQRENLALLIATMLSERVEPRGSPDIEPRGSPDIEPRGSPDIEPMFPDFKTRGFGLEDIQIRYPDRLARLIPVMTLALYFAVSTGQWDAAHHATPAERKRPEHRPKNVLRSMTPWFTRDLRHIANLLQTIQPIPQL